MSTQGSRLTVLRLLVKIMSLVAVCAFLLVLFGSVPDSVPKGGQVKAEVTRFNISDMQPGDYRLVEWQKKPVYVVYRKPEWEAALQLAEKSLYRDPNSEKSEQPEGFNNALRSNVSGWFVTLGLGTGTGCSLVFSPSIEQNNDSLGHFTDGCDQSRFDLSGRVYEKQAAKRNTVIPAWRIENSELLISD